nr:four helix bundle protein [uncultured Prevotella sp.]
MDYFYYKKLEVYQYSKELVTAVYQLLSLFPQEEKFALCDQLRRAVISIPSNIAEGFGRVSTKEKVHFIEIAYGSLMEVSCQLDIAKDLKYLRESDFITLMQQMEAIARMLSALRFSIIKNGDSSLTRLNNK